MNLRHQVSILLATGGALVSLYLTAYKLGWIGEVVCMGGGCGRVQASPYATFLGIPNAVWGLGFYLLLTLLGILRLERPHPILTPVLWGLTLWGVGFSTYLTGLEIFVIRAICTWCVVSYILVLLLFGIETWNFVDSKKVQRTFSHPQRLPQ